MKTNEKANENTNLKSNLKAIISSLNVMRELDSTVFWSSIIVTFISYGIPYIGILLSAYLLDSFSSNKESKYIFFVVFVVVVLVSILVIVKSYVQKICDIHTEICVQKYDMEMGKKTLTMDYELLDSPTVNEIRNRIKTDNQWGAGFYTMIWLIPYILGSVFSMMFSLIILFPLFANKAFLFNKYTLITGIVLTCLIILQIVFSAKQSKKFHEIIPKFRGEKYRSYFIQGGLDYKIGKDIRIYHTEKMIFSYMEGEAAEKDYWAEKLVNNKSLSGFIDGLGSGILQGGSYVFMVILALEGALSIGEVVKYAATIYLFARYLVLFFDAFTEYVLGAKRQLAILEFMEFPNVLYKGSLPVEKRDDNDYEVKFKNVSFKYPGNEAYSLKNLSLTFRIGRKLAVVGMNGSGKTTMIKLLCRLYDPTEGIITLNGIDIKKYEEIEYRSIFSVVFQDFNLFSISLGQNVATAIEYDKEKVKECLEKVGLKERVDSMPLGLDTCLYKHYEENGVEISGGEAQKIAIARALYKEAPFVILDEPTAALDPIAEYEIYARFHDLVTDKTAIYISHRLSSCRFCDEIIVFHEGELIQQGNHDILVSDEQGKYYELWQAQAQYYNVTG